MHPWSVAWLDIKVFIAETAANRQCDTDFATDVTDFSEAIRHYFRRQKHVSVMTYASVGSDGAKSSQVLIEPNVKPNSAGYCENAGRKCVSVDTKNTYTTNIFTAQDSAPALTAANTQTWCVAPRRMVQTASQLLHFRKKCGHL